MVIRPVYVFYDRGCATCHFVVKHLLRRKARERFRFLPMEELSRYRQREGEQINSIRVVENGNLYESAAAVFMILSTLGWPWNLFALFRLIPSFASNFLYDAYARNRYRIAGRADPSKTCDLPPRGAGHLLLDKIPDDFVFFEPRAGQFLNAQWLRLVFLNYEVDPKLLLPLVPRGTELDFYEGRCYCSVVGFLFANTRLGSIRIPGHAAFEEVNLRFYVKRKEFVDGKTKVKRGVVFVKELVPRVAIAGLARLLFNENYVSTPMSHEISPGRIRYSWTNKRGPCSLVAEIEGNAKEIKDGSFDEFITEHYFGYVAQRGGRSLEYEVEHPRWRVWNTSQVRLEGPVEATYGDDLGLALKGKFHSACVADGSEVRVFHGQKIT